MLLRGIVIGLIHSILYLWLVPFVILPLFGLNGWRVAIAVSVLVSMAIIGSAFFGGKRKDG